MPSIKKINENISQLTTFVDEYTALLKADPSNISHKLIRQSLENQISELQHQLYQENLKRQKEIVQLRMIGPVAKFGSFPLSMVGGLTESLSKAIFQTSKYVQFGNRGGNKIDRIITETIDLRLEGLGKGSTIFYLSAKTSPDLFGNSVIQHSLDNAFELLNSETPINIIDNISVVGSRSIKYYSNFFKELNDDHLEIEITWSTPDEAIKVWEGTKDKILSIYNTLNNIKISEPEEIHFEGEIITLSIKGKFEIYTKENERFYGTFPNELIDTIKQFHVGDYCKGIILKTQIYSPATEKEKNEYALKTISP